MSGELNRSIHPVPDHSQAEQRPELAITPGGIPAVEAGDTRMQGAPELRHENISGFAMSGDVTIREAWVQASSFLERCGIGEAPWSAELLLQHLLDWDRTTLYLQWHERFPAGLAESWERLLNRRASGEPVQYLIGRQEFYGLSFEVTPAVLIPRPETELLVERILFHGQRMWPEAGQQAGAATQQKPLANAAAEEGIFGDTGDLEEDTTSGRVRSAGILPGGPAVADVGTGSGAIPVTLAVHRPDWIVRSSDISADALAVARRNAALNGVAERVELLQGDLLEPYIRDGLPVDILVSNPPYIPSADIEELQTEVRDFEPRSALDGGADGLDLYRRMLGQISGLIAVPRLVGFEVGQGQAQAVAALLRKLGYWDEIEVIPDLAGIERHVLAIREK
ncbi:N5-glutamine methyltransferase family protein [Paenibacillus sp. y28]|uniref:N5-glutamine methyltransferase family protein n=1 Tax=Paenibacillus sp. y28 TaxID=3129110 RepID=UPI00301B2B81